MALPSWQRKATISDNAAPATPKVSFLEAKKFFAVDASGSGTSPECILEEPSAVEQIKGSDLWVLLTDGEIADHYVSTLTQMADAMDVIQVPVVLWITGRGPSTPDRANISVGISFFASAREALILFKDINTGRIYVIDAKGAFAPLGLERDNRDSGWSALPTYANEAEFNKRCGELDIALAQNEGRTITKAVALGTEWDAATDSALVDLSALLGQAHIDLKDLRNLLGEEAITRLALLCKIRGQLGVLRDLLIRHKQQEVIVRLEDRHGAARILEQMQSDTTNLEDKARLTAQLQTAHIANRETYQAMKNSPSEQSRLASETNKLIDRALAIIAGFEKSSYTADILNRKSNRAMRSKVVSADEGHVHLNAMDLSDEIEDFRGTCTICCGEDQIMSVALKRLDSVEENTTDFALNFPLAAAQAKQNADMVSSQCICFQCALLCPRSIYKEDIVAMIPTIDFWGVNKTYINHELTLAVTAGLATGASGIVQLFMTILDRTLETKNWCSKDHTEDPEVQFRREVLHWTLQNFLRRCKCRENFTETGKWVDYTQALSWAVDDYGSAGLDSWIIQYPMSGFSQLLRWYELLDLPVGQERIDAIARAKLVHQVVTVFMNGLLRKENGDKSWTHPFVQLIYQGFNAPDVPRDLGERSVLLADRFWPKLTDAMGHWQDVKRFLKFFEAGAQRKDRAELALRIQLITFWALYTQKGHTTPKTFFANIRSREPLASAILDPTAIIPHGAVRDILTSIFCPDSQRKLQDEHPSEVVPPFVSPFGPSVLRCGFPSCSITFYSKDDERPEAAGQGIRARRAKHFRDVYGIGPAFDSQTGLPDPTKAPKAPTSYHNTLHISTAKVWSRLDYEGKQAVASSVSQINEPAVNNFVRDVRLEICARSHRGNIYSATIEDEVRTILPSFLEALRVASEKLELEDKSGLAYVHDWTRNTIVGKMEYELSL